MENGAFIVILLIGLIYPIVCLYYALQEKFENRKIRKNDRIRYFISVVTDRYNINRPYVLKEELDRESITKSEIKEVINSGLVDNPTVMTFLRTYSKIIKKK